MPRQKGGRITDILYYIGIAIVGFFVFLLSLFSSQPGNDDNGQPGNDDNGQPGNDPSPPDYRPKKVPKINFIGHEEDQNQKTITLNFSVYDEQYNPYSNNNSRYYASVVPESTDKPIFINPTRQNITSDRLRFTASFTKYDTYFDVLNGLRSLVIILYDDYNELSSTKIDIY